MWPKVGLGMRDSVFSFWQGWDLGQSAGFRRLLVRLDIGCLGSSLIDGLYR